MRTLLIIYARNIATQREVLWKNLKAIFDGFSSPWLGAGDYNCVCYADEKLGGNLVTHQSLKAFNKCVSFYRLEDIHYVVRS